MKDVAHFGSRRSDPRNHSHQGEHRIRFYLCIYLVYRAPKLLSFDLDELLTNIFLCIFYYIQCIKQSKASVLLAKWNNLAIILKRVKAQDLRKVIPKSAYNTTKILIFIQLFVYYWTIIFSMSAFHMPSLLLWSSISKAHEILRYNLPSPVAFYLFYF